MVVGVVVVVELVVVVLELVVVVVVVVLELVVVVTGGATYCPTTILTVLPFLTLPVRRALVEHDPVFAGEPDVREGLCDDEPLGAQSRDGVAGKTADPRLD